MNSPQVNPRECRIYYLPVMSCMHACMHGPVPYYVLPPHSPRECCTRQKRTGRPSAPHISLLQRNALSSMTDQNNVSKHVVRLECVQFKQPGPRPPASLNDSAHSDNGPKITLPAGDFAPQPAAVIPRPYGSTERDFFGHDVAAPSQLQVPQLTSNLLQFARRPVESGSLCAGAGAISLPKLVRPRSGRARLPIPSAPWASRQRVAQTTSAGLLRVASPPACINPSRLLHGARRNSRLCRISEFGSRNWRYRTWAS